LKTKTHCTQDTSCVGARVFNPSSFVMSLLGVQMTGTSRMILGLWATCADFMT